ncbi:hypothetical protein NQ318_013426 [Aromia moschata]|uniref:Nose resistant-to-fluoxetine protein N-terminal domain-containing protein n=1 Tax=Aromia moschata TaxID=1265417 RepID=A0AAV8YR16_9CUCU|nr:hypothetical protein NQ318_013426 [Aromia moschata]
MKVIWVCLILAVLVSSSLESSSDSDQDYQEDSTLFAYPLLIFDFLKGRAEEILEEVGGNTECAKDLRLLVQDAIFREKWAIRNSNLRSDLKYPITLFPVLDASGKLPSGLLYGNYHVIGNFDECIEIREEKDDHVIDGKYCSVSVAPSAHFRTDLTDLLDSVAPKVDSIVKPFVPITRMDAEKLILAVRARPPLCDQQSKQYHNRDVTNKLGREMTFPTHAMRISLSERSLTEEAKTARRDAISTRKEEEAENLQLERASQIRGFNVTYQAADVIRLFKMTYGLCIPKSCSISYLQNIWDYAEHTFGIPFHIHFLDVLCAYKDMMKKKYRNNYLIAFSLYTNSKKLFSCNKLSEDDGNLQCINGIRVLSMLWIVFGHRMLFNSMMGSVNSIYALKVGTVGFTYTG